MNSVIRSKQSRAALALLAALLMLLTACTPTVSEVDSYALMANERHDAGLQGLIADEELHYKAKAWAEEMAASDHLRHSVLREGVYQSWTSLGENVGVGSDEAAVHAAFMASPSHRKNLMSTKYDRIGVGTATGPDGRVWVAHVFAGG